ncbi:hypothetical protein JW911_04755 [Candidatus Peregrinibacteria bacterium]|nr:hypothetical protein [Candidatus Peregrinibacteria bacterium]
MSKNLPENQDYAEYTVVKPEAKESWITKAVNAVRNGINTAAKKIMDASYGVGRLAKRASGPLAAATLVAAAPGLKGCVFDASGLAPTTDAKVESDRPINDGSIDAGDSQPDPDAGDAETDAGDGSTDPDAGDAQPTTETICNDGVDNDNDGKTDCADFDCVNHTGPNGMICEYQTETRCADGHDNDADGLTDCADPNCNNQSCGNGCACVGGEKTEHASGCSDGIDNDGDTLVDCDDPNCLGYVNTIGGWACDATTPGVIIETNCVDGVDNDGDGNTDCDDADCDGNPACPQTEICNDGVDNNANAYIDCIDADCKNALRCTAEWHNLCIAGANANDPCLTGAPLGTCYNGQCTEYTDTNGRRECKPNSTSCYSNQ